MPPAPRSAARRFRETVRARARRDPAFRKALKREAREAARAGPEGRKAARAILDDLRRASAP